MSLSSKTATSLGIAIGVLGRLLLQAGGGIGASGAVYDLVTTGHESDAETRFAWTIAGGVLGATYCFFDSTTQAEQPPENRHAFFATLAHARAHPSQAFRIEFRDDTQNEKQALMVNA